LQPVVVAADHAAAGLFEKLEIRLARSFAADRRRAAIGIERSIVFLLARALVGFKGLRLFVAQAKRFHAVRPFDRGHRRQLVSAVEVGHAVGARSGGLGRGLRGLRGKRDVAGADC
jgi:hypothetical protein